MARLRSTESPPVCRHYESSNARASSCRGGDFFARTAVCVLYLRQQKMTRVHTVRTHPAVRKNLTHTHKDPPFRCFLTEHVLYLFCSEGLYPIAVLFFISFISTIKHFCSHLSDDFFFHIIGSQELRVVLPAGTGTTALFLARYLVPEGIPVYTVPCAGDGAYLSRQMAKVGARGRG